MKMPLLARNWMDTGASHASSCGDSDFGGLGARGVVYRGVMLRATNLFADGRHRQEDGASLFRQPSRDHTRFCALLSDLIPHITHKL